MAWERRQLLITSDQWDSGSACPVLGVLTYTIQELHVISMKVNVFPTRTFVCQKWCKWGEGHGYLSLSPNKLLQRSPTLDTTQVSCKCSLPIPSSGILPSQLGFLLSSQAGQKNSCKWLPFEGCLQVSFPPLWTKMFKWLGREHGQKAHKSANLCVLNECSLAKLNWLTYLINLLKQQYLGNPEVLDPSPCSPQPHLLSTTSTQSQIAILSSDCKGHGGAAG